MALVQDAIKDLRKLMVQHLNQAERIKAAIHHLQGDTPGEFANEKAQDPAWAMLAKRMKADRRIKKSKRRKKR